MCKIQADVVLTTNSSIPVELIKANGDWIDILTSNLPFIITALIVLAAATVTYRSNRKSVESQNQLANRAREEEHENKISEFRHHWLQEVRETVSSLCQVMHEMQQIIVERNVTRNNLGQAIQLGDDENGSTFELQMKDSHKRLIAQRSNFYRLSAKIRLLFKSGDPATANVFTLIDAIKHEVYDFEKMVLEDEKIENIVKEFQDILKTEWEVTKDRSWKKTLNK